MQEPDHRSENAQFGIAIGPQRLSTSPLLHLALGVRADGAEEILDLWLGSARADSGSAAARTPRSPSSIGLKYLTTARRFFRSYVGEENSGRCRSPPC